MQFIFSAQLYFGNMFGIFFTGSIGCFLEASSIPLTSYRKTVKCCVLKCFHSLRCKSFSRFTFVFLPCFEKSFFYLFIFVIVLQLLFDRNVCMHQFVSCNNLFD